MTIANDRCSGSSRHRLEDARLLREVRRIPTRRERRHGLLCALIRFLLGQLDPQLLLPRVLVNVLPKLLDAPR